MFPDNDVIYQILLWLPVLSLLRFQSICRSWRSLIESSDFIKEHLRHHHYNPILKDNNHSLIYRLPGNYPPITFPLTSIDGFDAPNKCLQLNSSDVFELFPIEVSNIVSVNGLVCLNMDNKMGEQSICIWNPATKKSRILPISPFPLIGTRAKTRNTTTIGVGFDVKANEFKVVNLISNINCAEKRVEIYSFTEAQWRGVTNLIPEYLYIVSSGTPFNNKTSCCWYTEYGTIQEILCFDFISEMLRPLPFPDVDNPPVRPHLGVIMDRMACVFNVDVDSTSETDVWVFTEYGNINETWVKLCRIHPYSILRRKMSAVLLSISGEYIFFKNWDQFCRYNIITGEIKTLPGIENYENVLNGFPLPHPNMYYGFYEAILEFKESLVSIW